MIGRVNVFDMVFIIVDGCFFAVEQIGMCALVSALYYWVH